MDKMVNEENNYRTTYGELIANISQQRLCYLWIHHYIIITLTNIDVNQWRSSLLQPHYVGKQYAFQRMSVNLSWVEIKTSSLNSLEQGDAYMRQWTGPSLDQIMACRLFGAKPLSETMQTYF